MTLRRADQSPKSPRLACGPFVSTCGLRYCACAAGMAPNARAQPAAKARLVKVFFIMTADSLRALVSGRTSRRCTRFPREENVLLLAEQKRLGQPASPACRQQRVAQEASDRHRSDPAWHRGYRAGDMAHGGKIDIADQKRSTIRRPDP